MTRYYINPQPKITIIEIGLGVCIALLTGAVLMAPKVQAADFESMKKACVLYAQECDRADRLARQLKIDWNSKEGELCVIKPKLHKRGSRSTTAFTTK